MTAASPRPLECLSCSAGDGSYVLTKKLPQGDELSLYRCGSCGLVFSRDWRRFTRSEVYDYYADRIEWPEERIHVEVNTARLRELFDRLAAMVEAKTVLDVGCGSGELVRVAVEAGWDALGIDISEPAVAVAQRFGLPCIVEDVFSSSLDGRGWNVITMSEVVEHVPQPGQFIRRAEELLVPGGLLYLTTPNFSSLSRRVLGAGWKAIGPDHVGYFTEKTLRELFAQNSELQILEFFSKNISVQSLRALGPARLLRREAPPAPSAPSEFAGSPTAAPDYRLRQAIERSRVLQLGKRAVNEALKVTSLGDTMVVLARKPATAGR